MADRAEATRMESGVDVLVARLREDGVAAGRAEAEKLVHEAETRARAILEKAEAEARSKVDTARREAEAHRRAGEDALKAAARDTVLELKERLSQRFAEDVAKTVAGAMKDDDLIRRMILAVTARSREDAGIDAAGDIEVLLPRSAVGIDDLRRSPESLKEGSLSHFAAAVAADMLREGVRFGRAGDEAEGIRLSLADEGVSIDLTDRAVAEAILVHLQPRFRALLEGVVK
jgi:V/A-type H+/Na+-transporting ATPase subunit E